MTREQGTFIKVHDGMPEHPKVEPLSDTAFRLLIRTWCWCAKYKTDGLVRAAVWSGRGTAKARKELIDADLAELLDSGDVQMHDYLDWQRSAAEIEEHRERSRVNGAKGGRPPKTQKKPKPKPTGLPNANPDGTQTEPRKNPSTEELLRNSHREKEKGESDDSPPTPEASGNGRSRPRNEIFDALVEAFQIDVSKLTKSSGIGKVAAELKDVGATAAQIPVVHRAMCRKYGPDKVTLFSMAKHWHEFVAEPEQQRQHIFNPMDVPVRVQAS